MAASTIFCSKLTNPGRYPEPGQAPPTGSESKQNPQRIVGQSTRQRMPGWAWSFKGDDEHRTVAGIDKWAADPDVRSFRIGSVGRGNGERLCHVTRVAALLYAPGVSGISG